MKEYIGLLSIIYILVIIVRLKDNKKSFERYIKEYEEVKVQLRIISQKKNPFIMMKFTNFIFYIFLFLYYIANLVAFNKYLLINIFTYLLIGIMVYKLNKKLNINSLADFEEKIEYDKHFYHKKQKLSLLLGLVEFAYAFNSLSLISFYY